MGWGLSRNRRLKREDLELELSGHCGGLAIFYNNNIKLDFLYASDRIVDVKALLGSQVLFLSFVYGDPVPGARQEVWDKLIQIGSLRQDPWFMIGDFNELMGNHEKSGGAIRPVSSFVPFNSMIRECGMLEFPCYGDFLSWRGNRCNNQVVRCRLDRALGNEDWHSLFPCSRVDYLEMIGSDHRPIIASCELFGGRRFRQFRFDKRWMGKEGFSGAVEMGWNRTRNFRIPGFVDKIRNCRNSISWWRKQNVPNSKTLISSLKTALEDAKKYDSFSQSEIHILEKKLKDAYYDEELYWQQKSRKFWLRVGDKNTSFFHASTKQRRVRNKIVGLFDQQDVWDESSQGMERIASDYFKSLFTQSDVGGISEMVEAVKPFVTEHMNRELIKDVSELEVRKALSAMHPEKTPGPDGMTALFFQRFWPHLKGDLVALVREFFRTANIKKAEREGKITGIKVSRDSPPISHLLFADDSLFFCKAEEEQCSTVMNIIGNYGKASGQEVNLDKSSIMFGKKVVSEVKDKVKSVIKICKEGGMGPTWESQKVSEDHEYKSLVMFEIG
ncbi:PREDICTED: uncharacterized protein LOC104734080 [Camelina sativa]|uniref:Uncharacterized protein LOC104734080 n=1 Tax=Camelina sativa TaxID=90675 RepID=A0ABM0V6Y3_CAMSA|nr:PREDICTED: uncharacterized protein LOC104734080 [Camelina sativa]